MRAETAAILRNATGGDAASAERLAALLYEELRGIAERQFRREKPGHTLQPTAVVNEALVRLLGADHLYVDRTHFRAAAGNAIRHVLIDHARHRGALKRGGGGAQRVPLTDAGVISEAPVLDLLAVEEALARLRSLNDRQARVVEMRFYGGMTEPEIASVLGLSERTVRGDWLHARAWLRLQLGELEEQ